ncbi:1-deoxy-D-xylulose-5-phosphate synthase [Actinocrispum sp. NPDC049592]|uniref:1-deoxy-D-xylulose-5-phosphate synthase n=1 Tax=Actinocrispum sp. NPDC049592 TaxID=3154835 RepID=UPI0034292113
MTYPLLRRISDPRHLKALSHGQLAMVAQEIRAFLIENVTRTGGHLGPNLGVVELTLALHRVFDSPTDSIIFDTGHQCYVHKILTGRRDLFRTLRGTGGLAGYPQRSESRHDHVENSHASTALSYLDGLVKARQLLGETDRAVVAVVGDGALTGGMAWEALNNLGAAARPAIVVLNDNGRSYAPTVGGLADHLTALRDEIASKNLFRAFGLHYLGPVDGHNLPALEKTLRQARNLRRPVVVHCVTEKGRGYAPAEADENDRMHGIGVIDPTTGSAPTPSAASWTGLFGKEIARLGAEHPEIVCITAAMLRPVGLHAFAQRFPNRVFDVGIAEQHAVTSAAGLAMGGLHPVVCVYATFINRAIDQVLMDVALHRLPVTFVLDRAGITGPDGPSHHGMWDIALLSQIPGMRIASPRDTAELAAQLREALTTDDGPTALRFPKASAGPDIPARNRMDGIDILHRSERRPLDLLIVAAGTTAIPALRAASIVERHGYGVTVVDPRWLLPVNPTLVHLSDRHHLVVTVEDGVRTGGMGIALAQACVDARGRTPVLNMGIPRSFVHHGSRADVLARCGLDGESIARFALTALTTTRSAVSEGRSR